MIDMDRGVGVLATVAARMLRRDFDQRARALGLTRPQWRLLAAVRYAPGETQRSIAERLEIDATTLGRIVDRLEKANLVERRPDAVDRRTNRLYLAQSAGSLVEQLARFGRDGEERALAGFSDAEREALRAMLERMLANLG